MASFVDQLGPLPDSASDIAPSQIVSTPDRLKKGRRAGGAGEPKARITFDGDASDNLDELKDHIPSEIFEVDFTGNKAQDAAWLSQQANLAPFMSPSARSYFGTELFRLVGVDIASRVDWEEGARKGLDLADVAKRRARIQSADEAEAVEAPAPRYPLVTEAVIEFASDAFSNLLGDPQVAKAETISDEPDAPNAPSKTDRLQRLSDFISWQVMSADGGLWQEDTDTLLHHIPATGLAWRKRYPTGTHGPTSEFIPAFDVIVNAGVKNLKTAPRISHRFVKYPHEIRREVGLGQYFDVDPDSIRSGDFHTPSTFYEVHTWFDLDGDGFDEPWIFTIQESSQQVVALTAGFDEEGIHLDVNETSGEESLSFDQLQYFVAYRFIPAPDGSFYSWGFGHLLGALNESVDELVGAIIDMAKRNAEDSGVLGRIGSGLPESIDIRRGEISVIPTDGAELARNLVMFGAREVPQTLFAVLGALTDVGRRLASSVDLSQAPGNMPATTAMAIVEQGAKIYSGVYRRLWRAMGVEFQLVFDQAKRGVRGPLTFTQAGRDQVIKPEDFQDIPLITVNADPNVSTSAHKAALAQYYQGLAADPYTNQVELRKRMHALMRVPNATALISEPQGPGPDIEVKMRDVEIKAQKLEMERLELVAKLQESEQKAKLIAAQASHQFLLALTELANLRAGNSVAPQTPPGSGQPGGGGEGANKEGAKGDKEAAAPTPSPEAIAKAENAVREAFELLSKMVEGGSHGGVFGTGTPIGTPTASAVSGPRQGDIGRQYGGMAGPPANPSAPMPGQGQP